MENPIQTEMMIIGVAEETKWNDTKLEYKQDLNNSMFDTEHNKNSETGMMTVGWSLMWHSAPRVMFRRNILQNSSWICSVGS